MTDLDPTPWWQDAGLRAWLGSGFYLGLVIALVATLTQVSIPTENRDIVMALTGVLASGVAPTVSRFVGRRMTSDG